MPIKHTWIDIKGHEHIISDMSTDYILNCLRRCWRKPGWRDHMKAHLLNELESRGLKQTNPEYFV